MMQMGKHTEYKNVRGEGLCSEAHPCEARRESGRVQKQGELAL